MSMNLVFRTVQGGHKVPFPFQTPTDLSNAVFAADTVEERLGLIEAEVIAWTWDDQSIKDLLLEIEYRLRDPGLRLEIE